MLKPQQWTPGLPHMINRKVGGFGAAPTKNELNFYKLWLKEAFKGVSRPRIAVLGATPELRDIGLKLGAEVIAIDFNWDMIVKMNNLCTIKNRHKEMIMKADWLKVPLKPASFDAVIGDVSFNNVSFKNYPLLFKNVSDWLKPKGYMVIREIILPKKEEYRNFAAVLKDFEQNRISLAGLYLRMRFMVFTDRLYLAKSRTLKGEEVFKMLDNALKAKLVPPSIYKILNSRRNDIITTILHAKEYLSLLSKHFQLVRMEPGIKDRGGFYPLKMVSARKK